MPRRLVALALVLVTLGVACSGDAAPGDDQTRPEGGSTTDPTGSAAASDTTGDAGAGPGTDAGTGPEIDPASSDLVDLACSLPHQWLLRTWRGNMDDRSAELQILPHEPDFVGSGLPHVGPWAYTQDIPMFWYGPGHIAANGVVDRPVTLAGIAPTQAEILDFPFRPRDGVPMREAVGGSSSPPKLLITMVWDAAGDNVLNRWPNSWPYLESLIPQGTWYEQATVGTSPTSTAQTHATIGTGTFPDSHGLVAHRLRIGPTLTSPWKQGPLYFIDPTLADLYDVANDNEPIVGELGTVSIHLGMLGHGSLWGGGDKDIAAVREQLGAETLGAEGFEWNLTPSLQPYYRLPAYLNDVPGFGEDVRAVDAADGQIDGRWRTNEIEPLLGGFDTPARVPYQTRVLMEIIEREGFGQDEVTDLLFVNFKMVDYVTHIWTLDGVEMRDVVEAQDAALQDLVRFLDRTVGRGEWAFVLTADHGGVPDPQITGAFQISATPVAAGINATFDTDGDDRDIVELIQPTQIFIDEAELRDNGGALEDVARYVMELTKADVAQPGVAVPPEDAGDPAFEAAFPSSLMGLLPCLPEARA